MADAEIVLDDEERKALMLVWLAHQYGVGPQLHLPYLRHLQPAADRLVGRGVMYRLTGELEEGEPPEEAGYAIKDKAYEAHAEQLVAETGKDWGELLDELAPDRPQPPPDRRRELLAALLSYGRSNLDDLNEACDTDFTEAELADLRRSLGVPEHAAEGSDA